MARPGRMNQQISEGCLSYGVLMLFSALFGAAVVLWILSVRGTISPSWLPPLATVFTILGVFLALRQQILQLPPLRFLSSQSKQVYKNKLEQITEEQQKKPNFQNTGTLIIRSRNIAKVKVRLLEMYDENDSPVWIGSEYPCTLKKIYKMIYIGVIEDLIPGEYIVVEEPKDNPSQQPQQYYGSYQQPSEPSPVRGRL